MQNVDIVTVRDIFQLLRLRARLVVAGTLLAVTAGIAYAFLSPPIYRAEVLLAEVSSNSAGGSLSGLASQLGGLASLAGVSLGDSGSHSAEALATLQSRALIYSFIQKNELLPVLFPKKWDKTRKTWKPTDPDDIPTLWDGNEYFAKHVLRVVEDKKTGLITVAVDWTDPVVAARWVSELVTRTNESLRKNAIDLAGRNIQYLQQEIDRTSMVELRQAMFKLITNEIQTQMLAKTSADYAFKVIDPAVVPEKRVRPQRTLVILASLFAGLFLSSLLAFVLGSPSETASIHDV